MVSVISCWANPGKNVSHTIASLRRFSISSPVSPTMSVSTATVSEPRRGAGLGAARRTALKVRGVPGAG